ncbi:hypothetical protein [Lentzea pudingi]|uniref:hypothetical protein n=1 Tax=Lentzea pudingi TaxID=1789439 RepID=UPI001667331F|nr:hypothetical protein [Lentzea pudingi]
MNPPGEMSQPSPTIDAWLFVADIRPSRLCDEYPSDTDGALPPTAGGTRIG